MPDPKAKQLQGSVSTADAWLTRQVKSSGKLVSWWWGVRKDADGYHARCYFCGGVIVRGALNKGITTEQQAAIGTHRGQHWAEARGAGRAR